MLNFEFPNAEIHCFSFPPPCLNKQHPPSSTSPVQLIKVLFWEMCSLGSRNCGRFMDWATSICSKTYKKTLLPWNSALKRCSRVETPQHRVLENTLNMGSILHGLKWFYSRRDTKACKHNASQMWEVRTITWWMWCGNEPCNPCLSRTSDITLPWKGLRIFLDFY